eukprot:SAG25_NODE_7141_length_502_cov_0.880893_1_plen_28_part_10
MAVAVAISYLISGAGGGRGGAAAPPARG